MPAVHKDLTNADYVAWTQFLREADDWSLEKIRDFELSEIRRITEFAYQNTKGYRKLFDEAGVNPSDIKTLEDFKKFPFLTKEMIRDNLEDFSADVPNRFYVTTGGSTGIPTGMYRDPISFAKELASKAHQYYRIGWREGDRQIVFRGLQIDTPEATEFLPEFNELRCSTYQFGTEKMELYRQKAFEYKPEWIRCYPSSGYVFARYLKDSQKPFPPIKGMLCSSEQFYDFQKQLFEEVFGADARIFVHYGHYEMAALAGFCEYTDDYHVLPQYGYVELLDKNNNQVTKAGEVGEIVATSFIMHATPFIRYRTADLAVLKSNGCDKCGRPYQIWEKTEGRMQELIATKTGRFISTAMLNMHDNTYDHLKQFQLHQHELGSVIFRFIPKPSCSEEILREVKRTLQGKLGDDIELILEPVEEIPLTKRGKHRLLIQELDLKFDHPALSKALSL
jgi:phenylacetate-coenzyme A ligase PaaK-like adenylate-forming protein